MNGLVPMNILRKIQVGSFEASSSGVECGASPLPSPQVEREGVRHSHARSRLPACSVPRLHGVPFQKRWILAQHASLLAYRGVSRLLNSANRHLSPLCVYHAGRTRRKSAAVGPFLTPYVAMDAVPPVCLPSRYPTGRYTKRSRPSPRHQTPGTTVRHRTSRLLPSIVSPLPTYPVTAPISPG